MTPDQIEEMVINCRSADVERGDSYAWSHVMQQMALRLDSAIEIIRVYDHVLARFNVDVVHDVETWSPLMREMVETARSRDE